MKFLMCVSCTNMVDRASWKSFKEAAKIIMRVMWPWMAQADWSRTHFVKGFLGGSDGKELSCQCRRCRFYPWLQNIPWRRAWKPTPVFLPGEPHRQRSLVDSSPWGHKESDTTGWLTLSLHLQWSPGAATATDRTTIPSTLSTSQGLPDDAHSCSGGKNDSHRRCPETDFPRDSPQGLCTSRMPLVTPDLGALEQPPNAAVTPLQPKNGLLSFWPTLLCRADSRSTHASTKDPILFLFMAD